MTEPPWRLLYRIEVEEGKTEKVWLYTPLWGKQLNRKLKEGWKWIR